MTRRTDAQVKASRSNGRKGGRPATIDTAPLLDAIRAAGENCPSTELRNRFPSEWRKAQTAGEIATWREGAEFFVRLVAR